MRILIHSILPLLVIPGVANACWEQAARQRDVPVVLLQAMADVESGMNPAAVNNRHFQRTGTVDIGYMQVNSDARMLRNLGVTHRALFDPCTNVDAGARILAEKMVRYGRTWEAVGAYNASCVTMTAEQCLRVRMRYAWRVYRSLVRRTAPVSGDTARLASSVTVSSVSVR